MNVLLIGGASSFINNIILKMKKEGHRVYLLTGSRYDNRPYQSVFEKYNFNYDSTSLNEIFESIRPDVTIFMGAYDTNFSWKQEEEEAVNYSARMMNILMAYVMAGTGKFIYLSSSEVYSGNHDANITEDVVTNPSGYRGMVLSQAEEMCESYRVSCNKDILVLRLDNVYIVPEFQEDATDPCCEMIRQALFSYSISINPNRVFSMLYATDAIEGIYRIVAAKEVKKNLYNISSEINISEKELADRIVDCCGFTVKKEIHSNEHVRLVLSSKAYNEEFGSVALCQPDKLIKKIVDQMKRYRRTFVFGEERKKSLKERTREKLGDVVTKLIPFFENIVGFIIFTVAFIFLGKTENFSNVNVYLVYVLIFAIFYGQQQATISATLSVFGYFIVKLLGKNGSGVFVDSSTYIWIAELFIIGLIVGYMRDNNNKLKRESADEKDYLSQQLRDIKEINDSNVRVKNALENQLINQNNSVGKIYSITSELDAYSQEEVLFYAARIVSEIMKSKDVSIYTIENDSYARLISYTSAKAKTFGNSVKYNELGELSESLKEKNIFINKKLTDGIPVMASAICDEDKHMKIIVFVWSLPWESMTLGNSNQLVITSALIKNAVVRAGKYFEAMRDENHIGDSKLVECNAFRSIRDTYEKAMNEGLTECVVLKIIGNDNVSAIEKADALAQILREHDYVGALDEQCSEIAVLLANTSNNDARFVIDRIGKHGYDCEVI